MSILIVKYSFHRVDKHKAAVNVDFFNHLVNNGRKILFIIAVGDFVNIVRTCTQNVGDFSVNSAVFSVLYLNPD